MADKLKDRLRRGRLAAGLSQAELAKKIRVAQPTISTWEIGTSKPDKETLAKLEGILGPITNLGGKNDKSDDAPPPTDAVGAWLRKVRTETDMSIPELAKKSGLSLVTIYNVESGKSPNPQAETRRRLEKALGTTIPSDVRKEAENDQEVPGIGTLQDFDPHKLDQLPKLPGVYVFYDISDRPVYVGKGESIASRVKDHEEKFWFKRPIVESGSYVEIRDAKMRHSVEQVLIKFLKSNAVINKQSVDR